MLNALQHASGSNSTEWGSSLRATDAAVLELIAQAGWEDWTVGHIVSGIASTHRDLVLQRLLQASRAGQLPADVESLGETIAARPHPFVDWVARVLHRHDLVVVEPFVNLVLDVGLTDEQRAAIAALSTGWSWTQRLRLTKVLLDVPMWPLGQPDLALALLRPDHSEVESADALEAEIENATHLRSWGLVKWGLR